MNSASMNDFKKFNLMQHTPTTAGTGTNKNDMKTSPDNFLIPMSEFRKILKFMPEFNEPTGGGDFIILDWNTLMPVVEKIGYLYHEYPDYISDFMRISIGSHIQHVYKSVLKFIHFYNQNKK